MNLDCFKAYDVRGKVPEALSPALALEIGFAYVKEFNIKNVVMLRTSPKPWLQACSVPVPMWSVLACAEQKKSTMPLPIFRKTVFLLTAELW